MDSFIRLSDRRRFPCPVCGEGLEVRQSKKAKPYVVCSACGIQLFVRNQAGIRKFEKLVEEARGQNIWQRLEELKERYKKKCPKCGKEFWVEEGLISTSWLDGSFSGYRCPEADCDGIFKSGE